MIVKRPAWIAGWIVLLLLMQYSLRPFLAWRVQVDFLVLALLVIAVRTRPALAAFVGFALGVVTDALTPESFGAGALALGVVGFGASWLKGAFFTENLVLNGVFVFVGKWVYDLLYTMASHTMTIGDMALQLMLWSPLAALVTAVAALGVFLFARPPDVPRRR